jgi:hypothetical protein
MPGSGAGLNYAVKVLLKCAAATSEVYDSAVLYGPLLWEAAFFSKTSFQILAQGATATMSGWSVACYGTHDYRAYLMNQSPNVDPAAIPPGFTLPDTSWVKIALPQSETTPTWTNPIVAFGVTAFSPEPWVAVRVVATATSATGDIAITCTRIP